ncbi:MAG: CRISPR-associated endonuclease Cas2 [bacterium]
MYVIIVYDIEQERVTRACKYLRQYLNWVQNSVFEGELTKAQLLKVINGLMNIINIGKDSVIIYTMRDVKWIDREVIGVNKNPVTNIL